MKRSKGEKIFAGFNVVFLVLLGFLCLFPYINIIAKSFSSETAISAGQVVFTPIRPHLQAYEAAFKNIALINALFFTIRLTIIGTLTNLLFTILAAYPLSKPNLVGRKPYWRFILFTMFFSGGMIPLYLVNKELGLLDNMWVLILPGAVSTYNMIIMKTFFQNVPASLEESAELDGCTPIGTLIHIMLPLSVPMLASLGLFYAVGHWNQFMAPLIYMQSPEKFTLQVRLQQMIPADITQLSMEGSIQMELPDESMKAAAIIISTVPILIVYPFLQRYFVTGVMIGSVKG